MDRAKLITLLLGIVLLVPLTVVLVTSLLPPPYGYANPVAPELDYTLPAFDSASLTDAEMGHLVIGIEPDQIWIDDRWQKHKAMELVVLLQRAGGYQPHADDPMPRSGPSIRAARSVLTSGYDDHLQNFTGTKKRALSLQEGVLPPSERLLIQPLFDVASDAVKRTKRFRNLAGISYKPTVVMAISPKVPAETVIRVVYTLGQAEFNTFEFLVRSPTGLKVHRYSAAKLTGCVDIAEETACAQPMVYLRPDGADIVIIENYLHALPCGFGDRNIAAKTRWGDTRLTLDDRCPQIDYAEGPTVNELLAKFTHAEFCNVSSLIADKGVKWGDYLKIAADTKVVTSKNVAMAYLDEEMPDVCAISVTPTAP